MKAEVHLYCAACNRKLGIKLIDTADPDHNGKQLNKLILEHRQYCKYYRTRFEPAGITTRH
jgi:hypothetical protein